jgi:hypothetical protein
MFNDKEYFEVNREERHFGNLLIASIIYDDKFRKNFFDLINRKVNKSGYLQDTFDIYSETAILRDYWHDLGDYKDWTKELLRSRQEVINIFLEHFNIDVDIIQKYPLFWTGKINESKLWFPGHWSEKNSINILKEIQRENNIPNDNLCRIAWACNAKPDIMIISKDNCIVIELKVESGVGKNEFGYDQIQTQQDIIELAKKSVPYFQNKKFERIMVTEHNDANSISWSELLSGFTNELVKKHFSKIIKNN